MNNRTPPIRPTGSPFGGTPVRTVPRPGGSPPIVPKVFKLPSVDDPSHPLNPPNTSIPGTMPGDNPNDQPYPGGGGDPGGGIETPPETDPGGVPNPYRPPGGPGTQQNPHPGGGTDDPGHGPGNDGNTSPFRVIKTASSPSMGNRIPIPQGETGSPFIVPVTGPPTYQDNAGNVGAYAGPFDYWGQGGASGNRQLAGGQVFGGWSEQLKHPGFDAGTKNAIEQMGQGAIRSSYASAEDELARRAAQSGNMAGVPGAMALMSRNRASEMGKQALTSKIAEETFAAQQKESALAGLAGLYQGETGYMENLMGGRGAMAQQPFSKDTAQKGVTTGSGSTGGFSI